MVEPLIELQWAKDRLHLDCEDFDLTMMIDQATAVVMRWMKLDEYPDGWVIEGTSPPVFEVPADVQFRTLLVTGAIYKDREDPNETIEAILQAWWDRRDPTMA